jgi:2-polyprenyl-6-methoxyphenol hydroxylase-like FAD-dependent oxidoreductase
LQNNIDVTLVEMATELDKQLRATHYGGPAVIELARAGVLDDVRAQGFTSNGICLRKLDGTYLAGVQGKVEEGNPGNMGCLPLNKLGQILVNHITRYPNAEVLWGHEFIAIEQDDKTARVTVKSAQGTKTLEGNYVVGCDGANSKVRRLLFGEWGFSGYTWSEQIVATNV